MVHDWLAQFMDVFLLLTLLWHNALLSLVGLVFCLTSHQVSSHDLLLNRGSYDGKFKV